MFKVRYSYLLEQFADPAPILKEIGRLTIEQPSPDRLILDGTMRGKQVRIETTYFGPKGFRLNDATFRWLQDIPMNRSSTFWPPLIKNSEIRFFGSFFAI